jgi:hypothetical protein
MGPDAIAGALDQALDTAIMQLAAARFAAVLEDGSRDYLDPDDLRDITEHVAAGLDGWRPRAGLHARVAALCRHQDIKVVP